MLSRPVPIHPLLISKLNTFAQIVLAGLVLAELGLGLGVESARAVPHSGHRRAYHRLGRGLFLGLARAYGELRA